MAAVLEERPVEAEPLDRRRMNLVFVTILVGMLLAALDQTIVATALPTIVGDLGGAGHLSWVVSSYLLADTIATVLAGKFGDQFGRKLLFQVSAAVFVVASAMCGLAGSMSWLIGWRAVQGFTAGCLDEIGKVVTAMRAWLAEELSDWDVDDAQLAAALGDLATRFVEESPELTPQPGLAIAGGDRRAGS